jgi:hypothetical protein
MLDIGAFRRMRKSLLQSITSSLVLSGSAKIESLLL